MNIFFFFIENLRTRIFPIVLIVILVMNNFLVFGKYVYADIEAVLGVTKITAVKTFAIADGDYSNGWSWIFDVTVPESETALNMKFDDWVNGSYSISAAGNMHFYSAESLSAFSPGSAIPITVSRTYSGMMDIDVNKDLSTLDGRQIQIMVEVKIPVGSAGGSYSTSYGIQSNATVINTPAIAGVIAPIAGAIPISTITATNEYSATITWSGSPSTFAPNTIYTATITIVPKAGFTLRGVAENFFTVVGAITTNANDSESITAEFPRTESGTPDSGGGTEPSP